MKHVHKVLMGTVAAFVLVAVTGFATGQAEDTDSGEAVPQVVFWDHLRDPNITDRPDNQLVHDTIMRAVGIDVVVNYLPADNREEKLNLILASGDPIDTWLQPTGSVFHYVENGGLLKPVTDIIEKYPNLMDRSKIPDRAWERLRFVDGEIYAAPNLSFNTKHALYIRTDWLEATGDDPPETVEEFETLLLKWKDADLDGNGQDDTVPFLHGNNMGHNSHFFLGAFVETGNSNWIDSDGKVKPVFMADGYEDYLATLARWYELGIFHPEEYILKKTQRQEIFNQNRVGVLGGYYTRYNWQFALQKTVPEAEFVPLDPPDGPVENSGVLAQNEVLSTRVIHIDSPHAEKIVELWDYSISDEADALLTLGIEGKHFVWTDKSAKVWDFPEGVTIENAPYYTKYAFVGILDPSVLTGAQDPLGPMRVYMKQEKYPMYYALDHGYVYSWSDTLVENVLGDLDTLISEAEVEIITGSRSVDEWDSVIDTYLQIGGQDYIEELTKQYFAQAD